MNLEKYKCEGQMSLADLDDSWFGKMSLEHTVPITEMTLGQSSKKRLESKTPMPLFLDLRTENGHLADASWETDTPWLGARMMHSIGECLNAEKGFVYSLTLKGTPPEEYFLKLNCGEKPLTERPSKLSRILETNPDPKFNLSAKACQGILARAERRKKVLPPMLKDALIRQGGALSFQERAGKPGGGKGILIAKERTGSLSTLSNQMVFDASRRHNQDSQNTVEQHGICYGLDRASFNQGKNAQFNFSVDEELAQTVVAKGPGGVLTQQ